MFMLKMFMYLLSLMIIMNVLEAVVKKGNICNSLYYGEMDKIMINTQNYRTKYVIENLYKRRATQSGLTFGQVKTCYESKKKVKRK